MAEIQEKFIYINDLRLHYLESGEGYPLVLLHEGGGSAKFNWEKHIPILAKTFRVIALDSRGQGQSNNPKGSLSYQMMTQDTIAFIESLQLSKPIICGWSDGGQIALEIGIQSSDLPLGLIAGGVMYEYIEQHKTESTDIDIFHPDTLDFDLIEKSDPEYVSNLKSIYGSEKWKKTLESVVKLWYDKLGYPGDRIKAITGSVLIISGDRDSGIPVEHAISMYRMISKGELAIMPNADHGIARNDVELFCELILAYWKRIKPEDILIH